MWKKKKIGIIGLVIIIVTLFRFGPAIAEPEAQSDGEPLIVVIKSIPPFVIIEDERISGFSIDLWEELAQQMEIPFEYVVVDTVEDQLQMIVDGEADLAISAITINSEREDMMDFSDPYYNSGLRIMTRSGGGQLAWNLLSLVLSPEALEIVFAFVFIMFIIGNLVWLLERKKNSEEFPQGYLKGVWEGIWWSIVTVTTVGYGDKAPRSIFGRLLGMSTILFGLFLIANFTAAITTQLTLEGLRSSISSVEDLPGKRVVTVADSTASQYLTDNYIHHNTTETIEEAVEQLINDQADAIVYDGPILQYLAITEAKGEVQVVGAVLQPEFYGVPLPLGSPYRKIINKAIMDAVQNGALDEVRQKWFGE